MTRNYFAYVKPFGNESSTGFEYSAALIAYLGIHLLLVPENIFE